jgi:hypothetical protein
MGFLANVATLARIADSPVFNGTPNYSTGIKSPWAGDLSGKLIPDDWLELFGSEYDWMTRGYAMTLPGVFRARAILLTLIADKPLTAWRGADLLPDEDQPSFLYRTPGILGPWERMRRTIDDMIFYPYSLWLTERGAESAGRRPILNAVHCPYESWRINVAGQIEIVNQDGGWDVASEDEVILFPSPSEGLLAYAGRTLRGSAAIEQAWVARAKNPSPITEIHLTDDTQLNDDETLQVQTDFVTGRRAENGSVIVTPSNIEIIERGATGSDSALYIEGRNASRLDIAAFFNLPGAILDATTAQASLTYVTQEGTRTSVYDLSLPYWVRPIEARLSQDDIVPRGQSVRLDFSSLTQQTPPVTED